MKTLMLLALIGLGVVGVLYARVDLGMSWNDLKVWAGNLSSTRLLPLLVITWMPVVAWLVARRVVRR